jgi:beta-lactamase class A
MMTKRHVLAGLATSAVGYGLSTMGSSAADMAWLKAELARIETRSAGRLGVAVFDTGSQMRVDHRADERFPICSTFKLLAVAAVLKRVEENKERLDRRIRFEAGEIVVNSAVTKSRRG